MTNTEVRKLRKKVLIDMLLKQMEDNERMTEEIEELKKELAYKETQITNAGTIAEAAFEMNGVLAAAEAAAQQYLRDVKALTERQEAESILREKAVAAKCIAQEQATFERCNYMKEEIEKVCRELDAETKKKCEELEKETEEKCLAMTRKAEQDIEEKWNELSTRLEEFYRAHIGLKTLLTADAAIQR